MQNDKSTIKTLIVIPCFNQLQYTKWTLDSIKLEPDQALFLINNGSHDETREYLMEYAKNDGVFFLDLEKNVGCARSWNMGIQMAFENLNCENCLILNNDILLKKNTIPMMIADLKRDGVALISGINISGKCSTEEEFFGLPEGEGGAYSEDPDFSCFGINKKSYLDVGLFDPQIYPAYFEDNDYHRRIMLVGLKAQKNKCNSYWHYGSRCLKGDPLVTDWLQYCFLLNQNYYHKKWGGFPGEETYTIPFNGEQYERTDYFDFDRYKKEIRGFES